MKKLFTILAFASAFLSLPCQMKAQTFEFGSVFYKVTSAEEKLCKVVDSPDAIRTIDIPSQVEFEGEMYAVKEIDDQAFMYTGVRYVTIGDGVTKIGKQAFAECRDLREITLPNTLETLDNYALYNCYALTTITIPESTTFVGVGTFFGCVSLESAFLSPNQGNIASNCFSTCQNLFTLEIPEGISRIEAWAMMECSSIEELTLPASLTYVGMNALMGCNKLKSVTCEGTTPAIGGSSSFTSTVYENATLYVPEGCKDAYMKVEPWSNFKNISDPAGVSSADAVANFSLNNRIITANSEKLDIYDMAGMRLCSLMPGNTTLLPASGVYIVKGYSFAEKFVVK